MRHLRRRVTVAFTTSLTLLASLALTALPVAAQDEGCPAPTASLVSFSWNGSAFAPDGGDAQGVQVSGDADTAWWASAQTISALVLTAGGSSYNVALDMPETVGTISPHNYGVFGGAQLEALTFCTGEKTHPDTTTRGPSIQLSKTAECATMNEDGTATVVGTITAELDSPMAARITSALDSILVGGNSIVHQEAVSDLVGVVLTPADDEVTVSYEVTFDPGDAVTFDNFIEVTIEDAATGEDRQKVYNARVGFSACQVPSEEPSSEPSEEPSTVPSETSGVEGGNPTPTPGDLPDTSVGQSGPMPATALAMLMLAAVATLVYVRLAQRR